MDDVNKVGDDTLVEETADDGASSEDAEQTSDKKEDVAPKDDDSKKAEVAANQRIRAEKAEKELKELKTKAPGDIDKRVHEILEKRDLDAMPYPDDLKKAIASVAKINEITVTKAKSDPYIAAKIAKWEKDTKADEAAISTNHNSGSSTADDFSNPPDVDLSTEKGRKEYDDWKAKAIKAETAKRKE